VRARIFQPTSTNIKSRLRPGPYQCRALLSALKVGVLGLEEGYLGRSVGKKSGRGENPKHLSTKRGKLLLSRGTAMERRKITKKKPEETGEGRRQHKGP